MKQVTHTLRTGRSTLPTSRPYADRQFVLLRTTASVISAGTEKTKIDMGKRICLIRPRARPDLVRQVIRKIRSEGLAKTFNTVNTRLGAANPLGYSSAGAAVAVGGLVQGLSPAIGSPAAARVMLTMRARGRAEKSGGQGACRVTDEEAAFATLGAIALQGVRLADPKLGETVLVLGLGCWGRSSYSCFRPTAAEFWPPISTPSW